MFSGPSRHRRGNHCWHHPLFELRLERLEWAKYFICSSTQRMKKISDTLIRSPWPRSPESFLIWDIGRSPSVRWWGPNIRHRDGGPSRVSSCLNTPQCGESGWLREICLGEVHWWDVCSAAGAADEGSGGAVLLLLKASIFHHMVENRLQERRRSEKRRQESRQQGSYVILTWNHEQSWCEGSSPTVLSLGWGLVESADIDMKTQ